MSKARDKAVELAQHYLVDIHEAPGNGPGFSEVETLVDSIIDAAVHKVQLDTILTQDPLGVLSINDAHRGRTRKPGLVVRDDQGRRITLEDTVCEECEKRAGPPSGGRWSELDPAAMAAVSGLVNTIASHGLAAADLAAIIHDAQVQIGREATK
jgi:hypothetical protein